MTRFMKLAALAALVMLVASCCPCRKHRKGDGKPFVGTEWQLVQLNGRAVPVEGDLFTVVFGEDGRLSGLGACNRFMGSYQTTETGGLTVGQNMASTRMFCPDLDREQAFGDVLSGATHYEVDGDMLMLLTDGELRAVLQAGWRDGADLAGGEPFGVPPPVFTGSCISSFVRCFDHRVFRSVFIILLCEISVTEK